MRVSLLSSGSKANCTYVEVNGARFLIDCGLSHRQVELRLRSLGIDPATLTAIIITHEHADHSRGVASVSRRYKIPVYVNDGAKWSVDGSAFINRFETEIPFQLGEAMVSPFPIPHDAANPVGFRIQDESATFTYLTDAGHVTPTITQMVRDVDMLALESNHDEELLWLCSYPWDIKQRIASDNGHLSNLTAGNLLASVLSPRLKFVVLAHISENSNTHDLAAGTVRGCLPKEISLGLSCASVGRPTEVFRLGGEGEVACSKIASG